MRQTFVTHANNWTGGAACVHATALIRSSLEQSPHQKER